MRSCTSDRLGMAIDFVHISFISIEEFRFRSQTNAQLRHANENGLGRKQNYAYRKERKKERVEKIKKKEQYLILHDA